jgi:hypothetical protein
MDPLGLQMEIGFWAIRWFTTGVSMVQKWAVLPVLAINSNRQDEIGKVGPMFLVGSDDN